MFIATDSIKKRQCIYMSDKRENAYIFTCIYVCVYTYKTFNKIWNKKASANFKSVQVLLKL